MVSLNEDSNRINYRNTDTIKQVYDQSFTNGSIYKWNEQFQYFNFVFEGDRVIILSSRGPEYGKVRIILLNEENGDLYDPGFSNVIPIVGGNSDGSVTIDLDSGVRGGVITQTVIFDTDDWFPNGLKWQHYRLAFETDASNGNFTTTTGDVDADSFLARCHNCASPSGTSLVIPRFVYFDGIIAHERIALAINMENQNHLNMATSIAEALQVEVSTTDQGLRFEPRTGTDTDIILREGQYTLIDFDIVNDSSSIASILFSSGADINGLPLYTEVEDNRARARLVVQSCVLKITGLLLTICS